MKEPEKPYYLTEEEKAEMLRDVRAKLAQASAAWDREHHKTEDKTK